MDTLSENSKDFVGSSKTENASPEQIDNVDNLFKDGLKLFKDSKFEEAAEKLGTAANEASTLYGVFAPQCYKPNYYYGRSLVEIARSEEALLELPPGETDDEEDEQEEQTDLAKPNQEEVDSENISEKKDAELDGKIDSEHTVDDKPNEEIVEEAEANETLGEEVKENEDESSTKVAWEVLEVARTICEKQEQTPEWLLKKADVYTALGNCLLINEDVDGAIREYTSSLEIQTKNLQPYDRKLAETYFSMGQAYKTAADFKNAIENMEKAATVFQLAIENAEQNPQSEEDVAALKKLREEILDCIEDSKDSDVSLKKQMELQKVEIRSVLTKLMDNPQVNDVTNLLVRKSTKRSATEPGTEEVESDSSEIKGPEEKKIREV